MFRSSCVLTVVLKQARHVHSCDVPISQALIQHMTNIMSYVLHASKPHHLLISISNGKTHDEMKTSE